MARREKRNGDVGKQSQEPDESTKLDDPKSTADLKKRPLDGDQVFYLIIFGGDRWKLDRLAIWLNRRLIHNLREFFEIRMHDIPPVLTIRTILPKVLHNSLVIIDI